MDDDSTQKPEQQEVPVVEEQPKEPGTLPLETEAEEPVEEEPLEENKEVEVPAPDESTEAPENLVDETAGEKKKKKKTTLILLIVFLVLLVGGVVAYLLFSGGVKRDQRGDIDYNEKDEKDHISKSVFSIKGNDLDDFDLSFLKLENEKDKNIVYSPLSIKYALAMLNEGADGESKEQIEDILGAYHPKIYQNSANLSLANAFFVNSVYRDKIKDAYISSLSDNYRAEVIFDDFASPANINSWISNKTFNLVNDMLKETNPDLDYFYLINALAIDMEWVNKIQSDSMYNDSFMYESYSNRVMPLMGRSGALFGNTHVDASRVAATINKYNIIQELGEDGIRNAVQEKYNSWASDEQRTNHCTVDEIQSQAPNLDEYVNTLKNHYGYINSSTDFYLYSDEDVKVFAKDLKTYNGNTLQYVGIMSKQKELDEYIKDASASEINTLLGKLKSINLDSFSDGVITKIYGDIPWFDFDYDLSLQNDLAIMGITDIFIPEKANLGNLGTFDDDEVVFITKALHSANIAFSNDGIKAGAATVIGGGGGGGGDCRFSYNFEVPVEEIDLTFDHPYMFLVRDKDSGEVWFAGTVYEPTPF
ncbi:hypothetical protein IJF86_00980 [Candidatus Saccharibacteria bacterium]|nr:hypothetical protein [Candidatus Saccharibacteria bacterium]